ncbi:MULTISPECIES: hypothetical protein [unclassified Lentimicrobium]|uniref:hypothetical protein n=1 Tax=unclassified Lentimicrobium TaxID=2677434 RepID=UPI0015529F3E|nr:MULTISPECIES: hypothetical protein [unclassified Lentimicrobium]NPD46887.1 hypothetical protein [Lentimicrobium sp. S6]NPD83845.1 hypothetical protein [Lentimicrobium sp. L6]
MQHILTHTHNNTLFLQTAEIVQNGTVSILDQNERVLAQFKMEQTNYLSQEIELPSGPYSIHFEELDFSWKKQILI